MLVDLASRIDHAGSEAPILRFLAEHPAFLFSRYHRSANFWRVLPEFRFGSDFRADFLVAYGDSGSWKFTFVELESPRAKPFLNNGEPAKKLRTAIQQLQDWSHWVEANRDYFRDLLIKAFDGKPFYGCDVPNLPDRKCYMNISWSVIIGRRSMIQGENKIKRTWPIYGYHELNVHTYDWLLDHKDHLV